MNLDFTRAYWESRLRYPDWYIRLDEELKQLFFPVVHNDPQLKTFRHNVYELVEELLASNALPLAESGPDFDRERKPIDTVVIHHTEEEPDMSASKLSAIGLVRQYACEYLASDVLEERLRGRPIWSGHFRNGEMVFFAYHWLVRPDGMAVRLLEDACIGWHAGHWETNTRSIGIAFSGNYEHDTPPLAQIEAAANIITQHYPHVTKEGIIGHREVREDRTCPGAYFLHGWKETLLRGI